MNRICQLTRYAVGTNRQKSQQEKMVAAQTLLIQRQQLYTVLNYFQEFETKAVKAKYKIWKRKQGKALNTISVVYFLQNLLVYKKIHGRLLSIRVFLADGHYLNNRVFLSRSDRLIVATWKFDVLTTNICPRSEASRANILVLRTSNFQGTTIRPIVPRHKHTLLSLLFITKFSSGRQFKNQ